MNSKIPINVTIDSGSLSLPASPIFQKEKSTYACLRKIIPYKQFVYYLKKWEELGFYDYGVNQELGWFYPENFPDRYKEIIEGVEDFKEYKTGCVF